MPGAMAYRGQYTEGIPLRICDLEATPGTLVEACDPYQPLAVGVLQFLHDHRHSRDDRA
jgi:hypothetical protein